MSLFSISGLASGIDTAQMIEQLMQLERQPITRLQSGKQDLQAKMDAWRDVNRRLYNLQSRAADLRYQSLYGQYRAVSGDSAVLTATATSAASAGTYRVEVITLAGAHSVAGYQAAAITGNGVDDSRSAIGLSGTLTIAGQAVTVADTDSLNDIRTKINTTADTGVTASVVDNRLILTRNETGAAEMEIADSELSRALGLYVETEPGSEVYVMNTIREASNAVLRINNLEIERASNTVKDALEGVTLNLLSVGSGAITLTVQPDFDRVIKAVEALVEQYNSTYQFIREKTAVNVENETKGILYGESNLNQVLFQLRRAVTAPVRGAAGDYRGLADIGITTVKWGSAEPAGTIVLDRVKLAGALAADSAAVARLFGAIKPNVAAGAAVTASSALDANHPAESVVNGDSSSTRWGSGNGWVNDITDTFDDPETDASSDSGIWVKIEFRDESGNPAGRLIDQMRVYTLNSSSNPAEQYGIRDYDLQYWDGEAWRNLAEVRGNTVGTRSHLFEAVNTTAVRVKVYASNDSETAEHDYARITEIEVLGKSDGTGTRLEGYLQPLTRAVTGIIDRRVDNSRFQVKEMDRRMENMERRLEQREETLRRQFLAMEKALGQMMNQSQWMENQLNNIGSWNLADYRR
ncbi:MAG: flagellar filament capping protein FliD [Bacillota bacterium]